MNPPPHEKPFKLINIKHRDDVELYGYVHNGFIFRITVSVEGMSCENFPETLTTKTLMTRLKRSLNC